MVCYFKRICGINQAEDRVTWPDLLHRHTIALASFREWSVVSARLRIRAQPRNPCRARNSASAWTWLIGLKTQAIFNYFHLDYTITWHLSVTTISGSIVKKSTEQHQQSDWIIRSKPVVGDKRFSQLLTPGANRRSHFVLSYMAKYWTYSSVHWLKHIISSLVK